MDTETLSNQRSSDILTWTKPSRKISTETRQQQQKTSRKISNIINPSDALKEAFLLQTRGSRDDRPGRKTSMNWPSLAEEKNTKAAKFQPEMENTYKLEPDKSFPYGMVQTVMSEAFQRHLQGTQYNSSESSHKAKLISEDIKSKVKAMNIERYRIICVVHIGCNQGQELKIVSRSLWNPHVDTFATANFKSGNLFAVATVYAVYFE